MDAAKYVCSAKPLKSNILGLLYKITQKISFKRLYKNISLYFYELFHNIFLQHSAKRFFETFNKHFSQHSTKHLKSIFSQLRCKIGQKSASKDFIKTFPTYFSQIFFQHFSNRPYLNAKIIQAYSYIIKTILIHYRLPCRLAKWTS